MSDTCKLCTTLLNSLQFSLLQLCHSKLRVYPIVYKQDIHPLAIPQLEIAIERGTRRYIYKSKVDSYVENITHVWDGIITVPFEVFQILLEYVPDNDVRTNFELANQYLKSEINDISNSDEPMDEDLLEEIEDKIRFKLVSMFESKN